MSDLASYRRRAVPADVVLPPKLPAWTVEKVELSTSLRYPLMRLVSAEALSGFLRLHPVFVASEASKYRIVGGYLSFLLWRDWNDHHEEMGPTIEVLVVPADELAHFEELIVSECLLFPLVLQFGKTWISDSITRFKTIPQKERDEIFNAHVTEGRVRSALGVSPNAGKGSD